MKRCPADGARHGKSALQTSMGPADFRPSWPTLGHEPLAVAGQAKAGLTAPSSIRSARSVRVSRRVVRGIRPCLAASMRMILTDGRRPVRGTLGNGAKGETSSLAEGAAGGRATGRANKDEEDARILWASEESLYR